MINTIFLHVNLSFDHYSKQFFYLLRPGQFLQGPAFLPANITAKAGQIGLRGHKRWKYRCVRSINAVALVSWPHVHFVFTVKSDDLSNVHGYFDATVYGVTINLDCSVFLEIKTKIWFEKINYKKKHDLFMYFVFS